MGRRHLPPAIDEGLLGYLPEWTAGAVVEALAGFVHQRHGWAIKPEWVRPANSVLQVYRAVIDKMMEPGTPVVVPTPAYMPFMPIPKSMGREVPAAWARAVDAIVSLAK